MTDPIADYLTRLRNAIKAQHRVVEIPSSKLKKEITKILFDQGYILNYKFVEPEDAPVGTIKIALKYDAVDKVNAIKCLKRVSRPGLRQYAGYKDMPRVLNGLGIAIISTSKGVMTNKQAKAEKAVNPSIKVDVNDGQITVARPDDHRESRAQHGLYRARINNMVVGVSEGFKKEMEIVGVGYRATMKNPQTIELALGYSHVIYIKMPPEVKADAKTERNKNPLITLESCDKQLLGQICAKIRSFRKPEPYKGKGVKFVGEVIRRKSGKTAAAK